MTSRLEDLLDKIQRNWTLTGRTGSGEITWRVGEPEDLTRRFTKHPVSIEITPLTAIHIKRSRGRAKIRDLINLDVWILLEPYDEAEIESMRETMEDITDEIDNVVAEQQDDFTGFEFVYVQSKRQIDSLEQQVLRTQVTVVGIREV
jgi:hypothetical protein